MSRRKRLVSRHQKGMGPIAQEAEGISLESILPLVEAAGVSPTSFHRVSSLMLIFDSLMNRTRTGSRPADAHILQDLIGAARREDKDVGWMEDRTPKGDHLQASVRWGDTLYGVPRSLCRHQGDIVGSLRLTSEVVDPVLLEHVGFGLSDAVELALRRLDHVMATFAPSWPDAESQPEFASLLSDAEVAAAGRLLDITHQVSSCRFPDRAQRALEYFTAHPSSLAGVHGKPAITGQVIAVSGPDGKRVPVPARMLVDSLILIGGKLGEHAAQLDPDLDRIWRDAVMQHVGDLLVGARHPACGPIVLDDSDQFLHSAIIYTPRKVLVLDVVAGLQGAPLGERLSASTREIDILHGGFDMVVGGQLVSVSPQAEVLGLQVIAHPGIHPPLVRGSYDTVTLSEFAALARAVSPDPGDLWEIVRETTSLFRETGLPAGDLHEAWMAWRINGKQMPDPAHLEYGLVWPGIDSSATNWAYLCEDTAMERALLIAGLPPMSEWPYVEGGPNRFHVGDNTSETVYQMIAWDTPVIVSTLGVWDMSSYEQVESVNNFVNGLTRKIMGMSELSQAAIRREGIPLLTIQIAPQRDGNGGPPLTTTREDDTTITVKWTEKLMGMLGDPPLLEGLLGRSLAEVLEPEAALGFLAGWNASPHAVWDRSSS